MAQECNHNVTFRKDFLYMKKKILLIVLSCLLCVSLFPETAAAETTSSISLGAVHSGDALDMMIATTDSGTAAVTAGALPDNCSIVTEDRDGQRAHYLRGLPMVSGTCYFTISVTDPGAEEELIATLNCSIILYPAIPVFNAQDLNCFVGEDAKLDVTASVSDAGTISYEWYAINASDWSGKLLEGETGPVFKPSTEFIGTDYYYCIITNTNNGMREQKLTPALAVNVTEPTVTSIAIATLPDKREYTEGDRLDPRGLSLLVYYSNGTSVTENEGFTLSPEALDRPGTQTITVTYQEQTCTFPVIVNEAREVVEAIAVLTLPDKREYQQGEWLDTRGLVLQTITNKGTRSQVNGGFTCDPSVLSTPGIQTITVRYNDLTTSFTVTVKGGDKNVRQIEIHQMPTRLNYQAGDNFDSNGLVLKVITDQGEELIRSGFSCSPSRFTRDGAQTVTISYGGQSCTMELTVSPAAAAETAAPVVTASPARPQPGTTPTPERKSNSGSNPILMLILFIALLALVALLAYVFVSYREELRALFQPKKRHSEASEDRKK